LGVAGSFIGFDIGMVGESFMQGFQLLSDAESVRF